MHRGKPLPWYTYPAIDFLSGVDFSGQSVLEFGAGQSTLWWAERAAHVFSVEQDAPWFEAVRKAVKNKSNVEVHLRQESLKFAATPLGRTFDVIVIDGGDRFLCAQAALKMLQAGGVIVLDNAEGFWGDEGRYPIIDLFERDGFMRVDFYGFAPGVPKRHCTSLFFRDDARIFRNGHLETCDILRVKLGIAVVDALLGRSKRVFPPLAMMKTRNTSRSIMLLEFRHNMKMRSGFHCTTGEGLFI